MDISAAEDLIIARLKLQVPELPGRAFPIKQSDLAIIGAEKGDLLVRYLDSSYSNPIPKPDGSMLQDRTPRWQILIRYKNHAPKKGQVSGYTYIEAVRKALSGWTIPGVADATKLYPVNDGFVDEKDGLWAFQVLFTMSHPEAA